MIKIARIAVTLGLLSSLGAQAYAAGLVVNDNDLRNDLAWLSDRGVIHLSLSTWPLSQEEIARALKKAKPSYSSEQVVLARINQRLSALKADFRVTGYTSTDQPGTPQGFGQTQPADNSLGLAFNNSGEWWDVHLQGNVEGGGADQQRIALQRQRCLRRGEVLEPVALLWSGTTVVGTGL